MPRQRLRARSSSLGWGVARVLAVLVAVVAIYGGLVVLLLGLAVDRVDLNAVSGYRDVYGALAGLQAGDIDGIVRLVTGIAGLVLFAVCAMLLWRMVPRPYLARSDVRVAADDRGSVTVSARAVERAVEGAALGVPAVTEARGLYGTDHITVEVTASSAGAVVETLGLVRDKARASLQDHGLPSVPVDCTLTSLERKNRRELA